jgi:hypothetical protein
MSASGRTRKTRVLRLLAVLTGLALAGIGVRFLVDPAAAARFFGIGGAAVYPTAFHHVIALRDLWLGLLALGLVALGEWRALALWLGLGALVCFGDAVIAFAAGAKGYSIAFHSASGVFCGVLALLIRQHAAAPIVTPERDRENR